MNTHRIVTMVMAMAFTGFINTVTAEEKLDLSTVDAALSPNNYDLKSTEPATDLELTAPVQVSAQPADQLLSKIKIYPSF